MKKFRQFLAHREGWLLENDEKRAEEAQKKAKEIGSSYGMSSVDTWWLGYMITKYGPEALELLLKAITGGGA